MIEALAPEGSAGVTGKPLLKVADLHGWYGESHVLHGVDLEVAAGEVVTLLGRNGAGKTTTLKAVMGIRVSEEEEIAGLDMGELGMEAYPEFSKG